MAIQVSPTKDRERFNWIRHIHKPGTSTVCWVQDMKTGRLVRILCWGDKLYVPVYQDMYLGIVVYNDSEQIVALPTYVEALNIWENGPAQPEDCSPDYMWELQVHQQMPIDKLVSPDTQTGRPFKITRSGDGLTIGEASFGTEKFRGQIRIYERKCILRSPIVREPIAFGGQLGLQSHNLKSTGPVTRGGQPRLFGVRRDGKAAIGAGEEVRQVHHDTGIEYQRESTQILSLQIEFREDLEAMISKALGTGWVWHEQVPHQPRWWNRPWNWREHTSPPVTKTGKVAPHIPTS